jgi:hypothetical protein
MIPPPLYPPASYSAPPPASVPLSQLSDRLPPNRGVGILLMGILGVIGSVPLFLFPCAAPVCLVLGFIAWRMGSNDLKRIQRNRMSREGKGLVIAGYILGAVTSLLTLIVLAVLAVLAIIGLIALVVASRQPRSGFLWLPY